MQTHVSGMLLNPADDRHAPVHVQEHQLHSIAALAGDSPPLGQIARWQASRAAAPNCPLNIRLGLSRSSRAVAVRIQRQTVVLGVTHRSRFFKLRDLSGSTQMALPQCSVVTVLFSVKLRAAKHAVCLLQPLCAAAAQHIKKCSSLQRKGLHLCCSCCPTHPRDPYCQQRPMMW